MTPALAHTGRWAGLALALLVTVPAILRPLQGYPLDGVNLVFHETGHVLLAFSGETPMLLGGSLCSSCSFLRHASRCFWSAVTAPPPGC